MLPWYVTSSGKMLKICTFHNTHYMCPGSASHPYSDALRRGGGEMPGTSPCFTWAPWCCPYSVSAPPGRRGVEKHQRSQQNSCSGSLSTPCPARATPGASNMTCLAVPCSNSIAAGWKHPPSFLQPRKDDVVVQGPIEIIPCATLSTTAVSYQPLI